MSDRLPELPPLGTIVERLPVIFPEGSPQRAYLIRDLAARTLFVMFYVGAVEGTGTWIRPDQITRMSDAQAARTDDADRRDWTAASLKKKAHGSADRWYATNTREPIRDETLRNSLQPVGAVVERAGLAKTSASPRWAVAAEFATLFTCTDAEFAGLVEEWRRRHLTRGALARLALVQRGIAGGTTEGTRVTFPNGATRLLAPGTSSAIARAVIEEFAPRFLSVPGVLWVSETSRKDEAADMQLAAEVGLPINPNALLPDIILVDIGTDDPRFVFVEVVASDGPITEERKASLLELLAEGNHDPRSAAFVTAFLDRGSTVYRKLASSFAWDSFIWFASEPDKLIIHRDAELRPAGLFDLLSPTGPDTTP